MHLIGLYSYHQREKLSPTSYIITGVSAAAILEIRRAKAKFAEMWSGRTEHADLALGEVDFIDVEDEYDIKVGEELMLLFKEIILHCKDPSISLEVIRRLKAIADCFHGKWKKNEVELACEVICISMQDARTKSKRSRVNQSGLALLKDLSTDRVLKKRKLHLVPQNTIKKLLAREETDAGVQDAEQPPSKRPHLESEEDKYLELMETLAQTSNPEETLAVEQKLQAMGYEPHVQ